MRFRLRIKVGLIAGFFAAYHAAAVNISSFTPGFGSPGDLVTITGSGFYPGTLQVTFGGVRDFTATATAADGTVIQAQVPPGAVSGPITVAVNTVGNSASSLQDFVVIGAGPYITGFSPAQGSGSTAVRIEGSHFDRGGGMKVFFDGKVGTIVNPQITYVDVLAPAAATTGPITLSNSLGSFTTATNFFVPPAIAGFSPALGRESTNVIITGSNFRGALGVTFNGVNALSFTVLSNGAIAASVPATASTGKVRVNAPAGSATSTTNFVLLPVISGFTPAFGAVGTNVTITGANLNVGTPKVFFNGVQAATPTGVTFGQLTAKVPAGATTGPISVTTTDGSYATVPLFYLPPVITGISPTNSAAGTIVKISGTNFIDASAVSFNGLAAAAFWVSNNNTIGAVVPAGLATGPITVTTPGGIASSASRFYGPPLITGFSPTSGLPGDVVTVYGSNFLGVNLVSFGGVAAATFSATNNTVLYATVPPNAATGPITVVTPGGTNISTASFALNYSSDLYLAGSDSPDPVDVGGTLVYTVTVTNRGPFQSPNVQITSHLDKTVMVKSGVVSQGSWSTNGTEITAQLGTIAVNGGATFTLSVVPQSVGTITNLLDVSGGYPDPITTNNVVSLTTSVLPLPILSIRQTAADRVRLSWPASLSGYSLQYRPSLDSSSFWSNVIEPPAMIGDENVLSERATNSAVFYRLKK